ncbi:MAG: hypothetical protein O3C05_00150 [Proteobacteria bacterium]|nr:hypothetical protein [Pseudomonadota bacterium]
MKTGKVNIKFFSKASEKYCSIIGMNMIDLEISNHFLKSSLMRTNIATCNLHANSTKRFCTIQASGIYVSSIEQMELQEMALLGSNFHGLISLDMMQISGDIVIKNFTIQRDQENKALRFKIELQSTNYNVGQNLSIKP